VAAFTTLYPEKGDDRLNRQVPALISVIALGLVIWFVPPPQGLTEQAWHLFAIFISTIYAVITRAMPILTAAVLALPVSILTGTLTAEDAYSGFSEGFILLIVVAFLVARGVVKSGLGNRIAFLIISRFGRTTLGLGYSMALTDAVIAPAFPSNTARSGVLFPVVYSLAVNSGSKPDEETRKKVGSFLMMNSIAGLTISSALWLTAMAANPAGAAMAKDMGVRISFGSWFIASSVPSLAALIVIPYLLYKIFPPQLRETPEAPAAAREELRKMGPMSRNEWIMGAAFVGMVTGWALSGTLGIDRTAVAFLGLAVLMLSGIFTLKDLKSEGSALGIFIWFAILYTLSTFLNKYGFMSFVAEGLASRLEGLDWPVVYAALVVIYVLVHYLFVSQTAQMLALYGVFLQVAVQSQVPPGLVAYMLLFATNFFAAITPQGSSANVIFSGSGYLTQGEIYRNGAIVTFANMVIYLAAGTPWILFLGF